MPTLTSRACLLALPFLASLDAGAQTAARPAAAMGAMDAGQPPCPATPAALPPEFSGWSAAVPVRAASMPAELAAATIAPGRGVVATLSPMEAITYPAPLGHAGLPGTTGGLFAFSVEQGGTWRVAEGAGAWIDVVRDGRSLASVAHGHGPACSPIRKTVDFTLAPGRYLLQVSGSKAPTLALMIVRVQP